MIGWNIFGSFALILLVLQNPLGDVICNSATLDFNQIIQQLNIIFSNEKMLNHSDLVIRVDK